MLEAGTILQNRYRIEKQIGHGGMGAVYVATDERFASRVAIKETFFNDENFSKAFEREARLLNNLRHPALPKVSDHFSEENGQFLVMEYIEGLDLSEKMQETKTAFPIKDVLNWADQLLEALDFLHTQEMPVIHRDIKPQNLKLTSRGQIILLDFGLAKGNPTDASHKTAAHSVFGYSKNYASLEQMQGTGTDPRSDLYSLGATLYHLMTGSAPIDALTRAMTVLNGDTDPLKSADLLHNQVPISVAEVLLRAMALNANHRPSSAMAMRTMLAEAADNISAEYDTASGKKSVSGLLTQETELLENDGQAARDTEQTALLTARKLGAELDAKTIKKLNEQKAATQPNSAYGFSSAGTVGQQGKPKNGLLIGAVLGGLLMAVTAAGIYFVKPDLFGQQAQSVNSESANSAAQNSTNSAVAAENPAVISINANSFTNVNSAAETAAKKDVAEKNAKTSAQISSNEKKITPPQTPQPPKTPIVKEKEMGEDDVKINGERIETKDVIVDNGRVIFKNTNNRPRVQDGRPPLSNEQIKKLPPAERQRIRRILRRNIRVEDLPDDDDN